jgi:glucose-1-phosphate thymidylyltransferase
MEIAKAVILAGTGEHGAPWSAMPGRRHLFPVANQPVLFHNLEALRNAGVLEAAIVADAEISCAIQNAVGNGDDWGLNVTHAEWNSTVGLGAALCTVDDFLADEPVLVQRGDALLREHMHGHITQFARDRLDALELRLATPTAARRSDDATGYLLSPRAVSILQRSHAAGVDPIAGVRARGGRVSVAVVAGCLSLHGDVDALLESNRYALETLEGHVDPASLEQSTIHGTVRIHPTARISNSLIRGPVIVGPGAVVTDSYIGSYTSIGANVVVEAAEIEHSIVLPEAQLRFVGTRLESSLIGRGARVVRGFDVPAAIRVSLGDGAEVVLR